MAHKRGNNPKVNVLVSCSVDGCAGEFMYASQATHNNVLRFTIDGSYFGGLFKEIPDIVTICVEPVQVVAEIEPRSSDASKTFKLTRMKHELDADKLSLFPPPPGAARKTQKKSRLDKGLDACKEAKPPKPRRTGVRIREPAWRSKRSRRAEPEYTSGSSSGSGGDSGGDSENSSVVGACGGPGAVRAEPCEDLVEAAGDVEPVRPRAAPVRAGVLVWTIPGVGTLRYSCNNKLLVAHCLLGGSEYLCGVSTPRAHGPLKCCLNRTLRKGCIGMLVAWLRASQDSASQQDHFSMKNTLDFETRDTARRWLLLESAVADITHLFQMELELRGTNNEPRVIV